MNRRVFRISIPGIAECFANNFFRVLEVFRDLIEFASFIYSRSDSFGHRIAKADLDRALDILDESLGEAG